MIILYNQIIPVHPQPILLMLVNFQVAVADITVATCKQLFTIKNISKHRNYKGNIKIGTEFETFSHLT